jgi:large subunit ribosomal protein L4
MSKLSVHDIKGVAVSEIDFPDDLLTKKGHQAVHDVVVAYRAGLRAGTASTLGKGAVAGSGKKPWRQKGTGRARAGYRQSPVWRGGGVAHGPHPRSYEKKVSQKTARLAFRSVFSDLIREGRVRVVDQLAITEPKTKAALSLLASMGLDKGALILVDKLDKNVICSVRNLQNVEATTVHSVSTYQLLKYPVAVITRSAMDSLQARLAGGVGRKS